MARSATEIKEKSERSRRGQSLVEILIAVTIGAVMIGAAATLIASTLKSSGQTVKAQSGVALGKELLDNVSVWAAADWHNILGISTTSANIYHLTTSSSPFASVAGSESVAVASTTYTRYFYVDDVYRDSSGNITASGGAVDPSTKKLTVVYGWPGAASGTIVTYLTRSQNDFVLYQTNWSGGQGQTVPVTSTPDTFGTSSAVNSASTTGSITIQL